MKILLIHPQNYLQRYSTGIYGRSLRYAPLTMPTLKALVPRELNAEVRIIDEMVEEVPPDLKPDLVGITAITGTAPRAYEIAGRFRSKGIPVVLGGIHATLLPEEAAEYSDTVVSGYAERSWPRLLRDFSKGAMPKFYFDDEPLTPDLIVSPDRSSIHPRDYLGWRTVEMSRGCNNSCDFCICHSFHKNLLSRRQEDVIKEIKQLRGKTIFFLDPNLISDRDHAKAFFSEFRKLNKWWVGCASLDIVEDPELLDIVARSGCKGLLMGFESTNPSALISANKIRNQGKDYSEVLGILHDRGILVQACFVFGFDSDGPQVFDETADYILSSNFDLPQFSILTPFPGTEFYRRMQQEGRILTNDWSMYNGQNVVFQPRNMSPLQLEEGTDKVRKKCYSLSALARRMTIRPYLTKPIIALSYWHFRMYQRAIDNANRVFLRQNVPHKEKRYWR